MENQVLCPCCQKAMSLRITSWTWFCSGCHLWSSNLSPCFDGDETHLVASRDSAFRGLRLLNFSKIVQTLKRLPPPPSKDFLDVGCAQGWFLELAESEGFVPTGIEPEPSVASACIQEGRRVRLGLFPDVLIDGERFGCIIFNDVFEHLPHPRLMLKHCHKHLEPNGILILNLPSSEGFFFRLATQLAQVRFFGPFRRLWQADFYTPHLYYFNSRNLKEICAKEGFFFQQELRLKTLTIEGLWERINASKTGSTLPIRIIIFICAAIAAPIVNFLLPADTICLYFQRQTLQDPPC